MKKLRVGVIYGGRSGEHEVSIASAAAVFKHLDRSRYDPVPIRIEKDGRWTLADRPPAALAASEVIEQARLAKDGVLRDVERVAERLQVKPERLAENIAIFDFQLTDDEMAAITALTSANRRIANYGFSPDWDRP